MEKRNFYRTVLSPINFLLLGIAGVIVAIAEFFLAYKLNNLVISAQKGNSDFLKIAIFLLVLSILIGVLKKYIAYKEKMLTLIAEQNIIFTTIRSTIKFPRYSDEELLEGQWLSLNNSDAGAVGKMMGETIVELFVGLISFLAAVLFGIFTSPLLTGIILALGTSSILIPKLAEGVVRTTQEHRQGDQDRIQTLMLQILKTKMVIRIFQAQEPILRMFNKTYHKFSESVLDNYRRRSQMASLSLGIGFIFDVTIMVVSLVFVAYGKLSLGQFMGFSILNGSLMWIFYSMPIYYGQVINGRVSVDRISKYWRQERVYIDDKRDRAQMKMLSLENVSFTYQGSSRPILQNINFRMNLENPDKIVLTGPSGAGKSTFINLLIGLLRPTQGKIILSDGSGLTSGVSGKIALVPQKVQLFSTSLKENILLGRKINTSDFNRILSEVGLKKFVETLIDHENTFISQTEEDGAVDVSAGQLQKIGLARALVANSSLLILDEPTANLDSDSTKELLDELAKLDVSMIIITHRLEDVRDYMVHYRIENGTLTKE